MTSLNHYVHLLGGVDCSVETSTAQVGTSIDEALASLLDRFGLRQRVNAPTRNQNILDLVITADDSTTADMIRIHDAGLIYIYISDHQLVTWIMPAVTTKPITVEYSFRDIKKMDICRFKSLLKDSALFTIPETTTDLYAELFRSVVSEVLDSVAPLQTRFKQVGQKSNRWLSPEAISAKRHRRRL